MTWKTALVGFCVAASTCAAYVGRVARDVERLRALKEIGSDHVGYGGVPDAFYVMYSKLWHACSNQDLISMVKDPSPAVRIMAAKCILGTPSRKIDPAVVQPLIEDTTEIMVGPGGCMFRRMTVGEVVLALERDPNFLGPVGHRTRLVSIPTDWTAWKSRAWR